MSDVPSAVAQASSLTNWAMFSRQVSLKAEQVAVESARLTLTYAQLNRRAARLAQLLAQRGVVKGDRICTLSENDPDFIVLCIAALRLGACIATLNPRLAVAELQHCIQLVTPRLLLVSASQARRFSAEPALAPVTMEMGHATWLDRQLQDDDKAVAEADMPPETAEDIQFIIYTSGTTGLPKGAMISQRAMRARLMVYVLDYGITGEDTFLAWSPLCHMASVELGFGTLLLGGKVVVLDGAELPTICDYLENDNLSNLIFFPGMVEQALTYLRERKPKVRSLKKFGALADLYAPADIAELTRLLGHPFTNTFGSTETGMPPLSAGRLPVGEAPSDFGKLPSSMCEVRLCDEHGHEVPQGTVGELAVRGPTVFSGYWGAEAATMEVFQGGWYRTGDMFRLRSDGKYDYVDRRKYLIKSGGENVYPAEIERVVMKHPQIIDAVVVRRPDPQWGEVPVLIVVARGEPPEKEELLALCRQELAGFKRPKSLYFVEPSQLPRSATGKVVRAELEVWVAKQHKQHG